jgi:hypothetical protein
MNIQDALKETGKAHQKNRCFDSYVKTDPTGLLNWYFKENDEQRSITLLWDITDAAWQPYHEVKEIRPEKAGELWTDDGGLGNNNYLTFIEDNKLQLITAYGSCNARAAIGKDIAHNKKGWKRLYPPVESEKVRIGDKDFSICEEVEEYIDRLEQGLVDRDAKIEELMKADIRRILSPEYDSIERIEIEGVEDWKVSGFSTGNKTKYSVWLPNGMCEKLEDKPPMKMILEIPKDKP